MEEIMKIALANIGTVLFNRTSFNDGTHDTAMDLISMYDAASPELKKQLQTLWQIQHLTYEMLFRPTELISDDRFCVCGEPLVDCDDAYEHMTQGV